MKNQVIRNRYAALTILSQRVLPSKSAINKVAVLLSSRFAPAFEATEAGRKQVLAGLPLPEGWDDPKDRPPTFLAEMRQHAIDELMDESTPIRKIPEKLRLTSADLPKPLKKEGGDENASGIAQIRVMLGSLYVPDADERIDVASNEEEPDELSVVAPAPACAAPVDEFAPESVEA